MAEQTPSTQPGSETSRAFTIAALVAIGAVAAFVFFTGGESGVDAYNLALGTALLLAMAFGIFAGHLGQRLALLLAVTVAMAATISLPDLGRQIDDGLFLLIAGWAIIIVLIWLAWAIGAFVRRVYRAIVDTRR